MSLQQLLENTDFFNDTNEFPHLRVSDRKTMYSITFKTLPGLGVSNRPLSRSIALLRSMKGSEVFRQKHLGEFTVVDPLYSKSLLPFVLKVEDELS